MTNNMCRLLDIAIRPAVLPIYYPLRVFPLGRSHFVMYFLLQSEQEMTKLLYLNLYSEFRNSYTYIGTWL